MARQHGYFALVPVFIPVDKNNLANQIAAGQVLHEAAQKRDLAALMELDGIQYHTQYDRAGKPKDMHARWGSKDLGDASEPEGETRAVDVPQDEPAPDIEYLALEVDVEPAEESASARKRREARERAAA